MTFFNLFTRKKPMIGMIHLLPLVGFRGHPGINRVIERALGDLALLEKGGMDGALVENEFDHPHQVKGSPEVIAAMSYIVTEVVRRARIPIGVEVLLNDPKASLSIAHVAKAAYIRTDYFVDRMARDSHGGEMDIDPKGLMAYRKKIGAQHVSIFTDLQVKYAVLLEIGKTIAQSAKQAIYAGSDGLIITGATSGEPPVVDDVRQAHEAATGKIPVFIGSGFSPHCATQLLTYADGAIVGTAIKTKGRVDRRKVRKLLQIVRR